MDKLQLAMLFGAGFLLSRAFSVAELPEYLVGRLFSRGSLGLSRVAMIFVFLAAGLSLLVPNAVAVLTLLPIIGRLLEGSRLSGDKKEHRLAATAMALAVIYGANIGGMGSLTATPANGVFVAFLQAQEVDGRLQVQFINWLLWGIPLMVTLTTVAALVLVGALRPWRAQLRLSTAGHPVQRGGELSGLQRRVGVLVVGYFIMAMALSWGMVRLHMPAFVLGITSAMALVLGAFLFVVPAHSGPQARPPLRLRDCGSELPLRGLALMGVAIIIGAVLLFFNVHRGVGEVILPLITARLSPLLFAIALAFITSLLTEVLSNTAVQLALLTLLEPMATLLPLSTLKVGTIITLSSTCAFMSPIATGVNGLAFGGVRGASLAQMLWVGAVMNIVGAALIGSYVTLFVW